MRFIQMKRQLLFHFGVLKFNEHQSFVSFVCFVVLMDIIKYSTISERNRLK